MIRTQVVAPNGGLLPERTVQGALKESLGGSFGGREVVVLIPDHTRSLPLPMLFRALADILQDARRLDFLVALGTHPPLDEERLCRLVGISVEERRTVYRKIGLLNHAWENPATLADFGRLTQAQIRSIAGHRWHPSLGGDVDVRLNRAVKECDELLIIGPTFPHEVAGFSGGAKYLVPGISGPQMINTTHWLGALAGVVETIGRKETPVRGMVNAAATMLDVPVTLTALVAEGRGLAGVFVGDLHSAWNAAADLSARRHIRWCGRPFRRILSCAMPMYDELWTAAKAVYKLEPVVEEDGEIILYAPHLDAISIAHGEGIRAVGYHTLPYFLGDWDRFSGIPLAVLAHSTHVRGSGTMENGVEKPHHRVTLASKVPPEVCAQLNLGYLDPAGIRPQEWMDREEQGLLLVPHAGEKLYQLEGTRE